MIKNHQGKIYVRYYQPTPKFIVVGKKEYVATVQHGVSMVLADEEDVPALLAALGGCCGGKVKMFALPNQESVNVWLTGDR